MTDLRPQQVAQYEREGFLVARELVPRSHILELQKWCDELLAAPEVPGSIMKYYDEELRDAGREQVSRIEYFRPFHAGLRDFMEGEFMCEPVGQLLGKAAILFKDKINYKLPGGSGFEAHQDIQAGWDDYCPTHLTAAVCVDAATEANGCLEMAAGGHRLGLLGSRWRPLGESELDGLDFRPVMSVPGDVFFFGSYCPHRSAPNSTDQPRRFLYVTYNPASEGDHYEAYFAAKREAYPPDVERLSGHEYRYRV
jgi:hypothetical protein